MNNKTILYTKKIVRFKKNNKSKFDNTSTINITLTNDILTETEHKIKKRLIDTEIEKVLPIQENKNISNTQYNNTPRIRTYVKITKKDINSDIETYSLFIYYILDISHVLILTKYRIQNNTFIIYRTTNKLPEQIISDIIYSENLSHNTVIEKSQKNKILSNTETINIINALNSSESNTHPVLNIPLTDNLNPILLELYYTVINNSYISKTSSDMLSRLVWVILNL